jgi:Mrp family chromosome partitioning ATPase
VVPEPHEDYRELCSSLMNEWFVSHPMLAIVGAGPRESRAKVAARLAVCFAQLGAKTLLADAELPDPPANVQIKPVAAFDGLFLLLAPRERLASVVAEAGRRYRVVLIDSPAGEHRFAALAGAALVVTRPDEDRAAVEALEAALAKLQVRVAGRVLARAG